MVVFIRRTVKATPFPFDGMYGYKHSSLIDINGGVVIAYGIFMAQTPLTDDLRALFRRAFPK